MSMSGKIEELEQRIKELEERNKELNTEEICGDCKYWDTWGFNLREKASVGRCTKVAQSWYPMEPDKMISLIGTEHTRWPASDLIAVVTRREFGCNQWQKEVK